MKDLKHAQRRHFYVILDTISLSFSRIQLRERTSALPSPELLAKLNFFSISSCESQEEIS